MEPLQAFLKGSATGDLLPWQAQVDAADGFGLTLAQVEESALEAGLLPARYLRNRKAISLDDQVALFRARVAVIGCGGLGGYVIEQLARLGIGQLVAVDPDVFEEHNLNRQLLATPAALGKPKVEAARERVRIVNPAVGLVPIKVALGKENGAELLANATVAVDALDSIAARLELSQVCRESGIPLVHGAIGGWFGHVATQMPGDATVESIYRNWTRGKGIEQQFGNPAFTPAVVASLQVAEVCKIITGKGDLLRHRMLSLNLLHMNMEELALR